jgi:MshEN domain
MPRLGELLLDKDLITRRQFVEARERQGELGGRLGTALLEIGAISEEALLAVLAEQLHVQVADTGQLQGIPRAVTALLPTPLAVRCEAIPFRESASRVSVAMLDVRNLSIQDELSFAVGKKLTVHVANEARLFEALETYYQKTCPIRFHSLVERLNRSPRGMRLTPLRPSSATPGSGSAASGAAAPTSAFPGAPRSSLAPPSPTPPSPGHSARGPLRGRSHRRAQGPVSIPLSPEERAALGTVPVSEVSPGEAAAEPATAVARFESQMLEPDSPSAIGEALADALATLFARALVLQVNRGRVGGWLARGDGVDAARLARYEATLEELSVFREVAAQETIFTGVLQPLPAHLRLLDLWHGAPGEECLVAPVKVRDRLVAVLYGDRGAGGLEGLDVALIARLAARAAEGFERCIARKKGSAE